MNAASNSDNTGTTLNFKKVGSAEGGFWSTTSGRMDTFMLYIASLEQSGFQEIEDEIDMQLANVEWSFAPHGINSTFIYDTNVQVKSTEVGVCSCTDENGDQVGEDSASSYVLSVVVMCVILLFVY